MGEMLLPLLIGSSSFFQAKRTPINSWIGLKFGQMGRLTVELAALELLENLHRLIMGEMLLPIKCLQF